jgi:hypothetical protein
MSIKILASIEYQKETSGLKDFPTRYIWNAESINCFQETFAHPAVQNEIKQFLTNDISFEENGINKATNYIDKACKSSLKKKKIVNKRNKKWFDYDLNTMKRLVDEKAKLMSKFPKDPIVRGSFFNHNKKYAKLRRKKKESLNKKYWIVLKI